MITSPWGESYRPKVHSLLSVPVYSPYEAGNSSTDRFIEWQFGRATMAAYGRVIAPRDFSRSVNSGLKPVTARPSARVLRWAAFVALFLIFAWNVEFSWWHKFECLSTTGRSAISLLSGLPVMAGVLATLVWNPLDNGGVMVEELPQALFACVVRLLPDNLLVVAAIAIAPILALFLAVERQSRKSELTGPLLQSWPSIFGN